MISKTLHVIVLEKQKQHMDIIGVTLARKLSNNPVYNSQIIGKIKNINMVAFSIIFVVAIVGLIILVVIKRIGHLSGANGEKKVSKILNRLKQDDEIVLDNYIASRNITNTYSIQIDHIFISHKGVFIIETKDYRGRIYGNRYHNNWTQVLAYGNVKNKLYNPIKQNETHCNYINNLLNRKYFTHNVVIFVKADVSRVTDSAFILFEPYSFRRWYKHLPMDNYISAEEIQSIHNKLIDEMSNKHITKKEHINNIRRTHS